MNPNNYNKQRERALKRKIELIEYKGGKCEKCNYDKNIAAFEFHHLDPKDKKFQLDSRHLSNTNIIDLKTEVDKCILLCANCHRELHNKKFDKDNLKNLLIEYNLSSNVKIFDKPKKVIKCKYCGKDFDFVKGKIYCSDECRYKDKNYPSYEEINKTYNELKSWEKVAKSFNVTRKIIYGIIKRNKK